MSDNVEQEPTAVRRAAVVGLLCCAGALGGLLVVPEPAAQAARPVELVFAGVALPSELRPTDLAASEVQRYLNGRVLLRAGERTLAVRRADLGARVDVGKLGRLLATASDERSPLRRVHQAVLPKSPLRLPVPAVLDAEVATHWLLQLKDEIDRPAVEAQLDPRKKIAVPARPGVALDVYGSLERIDRGLADAAASIELAALAIPPRGRTHDVAKVDMSAVLGDFTTRYNRTAESEDRTHNLHVAAAKIDGYVLAPGEVFDFNAVVGDRTAHNGFRRAPVIADGELVDGVGGGTCQIASTLHGAVYFAGLPVLTRVPHSHPSYYIKLGLDATVVYGSVNFRFQNDRNHPLVIEATVDDGFVRVALHGKERAHTVSFLRRIDKTVPFDEKLVDDPSLPRTTRVLQQRGIPGFEITSFRVIRDERTGLARRERSQDTYPPSPQIWRIGSGPEAAPGYEPPRNDGHPEYLVDEVMSATQGPNIDGIELSATPGRTGTAGWIEREAMMKPAHPTAAAPTAAAALPAATSTGT
ncbi:MAG TPA: VanW family protein [Polyangiales bacterium]|nr:VanW family protein [Polyangiales bacterium]